MLAKNINTIAEFVYGTQFLPNMIGAGGSGRSTWWPTKYINYGAATHDDRAT